MNLIGLENVEGYTDDMLVKMNTLDSQQHKIQKDLEDQRRKEALKNFDYKELINNDIPKVLQLKNK